MATFNFDSETNIVSTKIPSVKAINKYFCGKRGAAGLWIADDNMLSCEWKKSCKDCQDDCVDHFIKTEKHCVTSLDGEISGRGIVNPRINVLRRTELLRMCNGKIEGKWIKGDGDVTDEHGIRKYTCVRRYLLVFMDENNKPLHTTPIQLTAKGTFQVDFDNSLKEFRTAMHTAYGKSMKRRIGFMKELWYAMCVFVPQFESKLVGKLNLKSEACVIKDYLVPDETNWLSMCVGRIPEINEIISIMYDESESWEKKNSGKIQSFDDDSVSVFSNNSR